MFSLYFRNDYFCLIYFSIYTAILSFQTKEVVGYGDEEIEVNGVGTFVSIEFVPKDVNERVAARSISVMVCGELSKFPAKCLIISLILYYTISTKIKS